jgi:hypothetical protein
MIEYAQVWLVSTLAQATTVARLMHTTWGWPAAESVHFIGLTLLVGTIGLFDLRLLGVGRRIPIAAMHRLVPWGVLGFALNATSGSLFLMAEPDQYVYNPSFHLKVVFLTVAGVNALLFYATGCWRQVAEERSFDAPLRAKAIAVVSLMAWIGVIVAGRLLTFHRPFPCEPGEAEWLATCIPGWNL